MFAINIKITMATSLHIKSENELHFLTFTIVGWIDIFSNRNFKDIIIENLSYCRKEKGLLIYAFVIMSNHIHIVARARDGFKLSGIVRDFKKYTSKKLFENLNNSNDPRRKWMKELFIESGEKNPNNTFIQLWQQHNHPIELFSNKVIDQKIDYIHNNPVKAGIVQTPEDYLYSSAGNYSELDSVMEIDLING
jgi:REP element-mobilizing transposase RayT